MKVCSCILAGTIHCLACPNNSILNSPHQMDFQNWREQVDKKTKHTRTYTVTSLEEIENKF